MADWTEILKPENLELPDPTLVREIRAEERTDLDGDPYVRVWVVLAERIQEQDLNWPLLAPTDAVICARIESEPGAGYPVVSFRTSEDQEAAERGDFYDVQLGEGEEDDVAA